VRFLPDRPLTLPMLWGPVAGGRLTANFAHTPRFLLGLYERPVVNVIRDHLKPGQVAYDIGANIGYMAIVMAKAVGPEGAVVAFEPSPRAYHMLVQNMSGRRSLSRITTLQMAVADHAGTEPFSDFAYDVVGHLGDSSSAYPDAEVTDVSVTSLDELALNDSSPVSAPNFVKIDVEGAEMRVLAGMPRLLADRHPSLLIELHEPSQAKDVDTLLASHGYKVGWRGSKWPEQRLYV
jgi:FkbM family methyltransferase